MKRWGLRIIIGILLTGLAVGTCLAVGYWILTPALRPSSPPMLNVPEVRRLNQDVANYRDPAWSPDGRYLAYARADVLGPPRGVDSTTFELYIMNVETGDIQQLTRNRREDRWPSWSPDGTQIAFWSSGESFSRLKVIDLNRAQVREVMECHQPCEWPAWSPDGQRLILVSSPSQDEPAELYLLNLVTGKPERLTDATFDALDPAWSPDGTRIAYTETDLSAFDPWSRPYSVWSNIAVININSRDGHRLTTGSVFDEDPTWSPNGRYLAFISTRGTRNESFDKKIFILDLKTNEISPLLEEGGFEGDFADPAWSPDGRYIAFVYGNLSTTTDLYIVEVPEALH